MRIGHGMALGATLGVLFGVGGYTFVYARGASYLTNDPAACANCHVMQEQYSGWLSSSHRSVATCNDCHAPHDAVGKYVTKMRNGFWHSFYFTTGRFPDPIRISTVNAGVTERTCRDCHGAVVQAIDAQPHAAGELGCVRCHRSVGHLH
ncbi:MAG: cytochrome c nitrite reductase small subunit [Acidobacteriota bacterium]